MNGARAGHVDAEPKAMGIAAEVGEHLLGAGERTFGIDDPLGGTQGAEALGKRARLGELGECAGETQLASFECCP
jgi:hypothetical protein